MFLLNAIYVKMFSSGTLPLRSIVMYISRYVAFLEGSKSKTSFLKFTQLSFFSGRDLVDFNICYFVMQCSSDVQVPLKRETLLKVGRSGLATSLI